MESENESKKALEELPVRKSPQYSWDFEDRDQNCKKSQFCDWVTD